MLDRFGAQPPKRITDLYNQVRDLDFDKPPILSGGVTMGLLDLLMTAPDLAPLRRDMGLNRQSVVLLISTEGDTDPVHYQKVMTHD